MTLQAIPASASAANQWAKRALDRVAATQDPIFDPEYAAFVAQIRRSGWKVSLGFGDKKYNVLITTTDIDKLLEEAAIQSAIHGSVQIRTARITREMAPPQLIQAEHELQREITPHTSRRTVPNARAYLSQLDSTFQFALFSLVVAVCLGGFTAFDLIRFASTGSGLLHPWLSFFLGLTSLGLLIVAVVSAIYTRSYLKKVVLTFADDK